MRKTLEWIRNRRKTSNVVIAIHGKSTTDLTLHSEVGSRAGWPIFYSPWCGSNESRMRNKGNPNQKGRWKISLFVGKNDFMYRKHKVSIWKIIWTKAPIHRSCQDTKPAYKSVSSIHILPQFFRKGRGGVNRSGQAWRGQSGWFWARYIK